MHQSRRDRQGQTNETASPPFRSSHEDNDEPHRKFRRTAVAEDPYRRGVDVDALPAGIRETFLQQRRLREEERLYAEAAARYPDPRLSLDSGSILDRQRELERLTALNLENYRSTQREDALRREMAELRTRLCAAKSDYDERAAAITQNPEVTEATYHRRLEAAVTSPVPMAPRGGNRELEALMVGHREGSISQPPSTPEDEQISRSGTRIANLQRLILEEEQNVQLLHERRRKRLQLHGDFESQPTRSLTGLEELLYNRNDSVSRLLMEERLQARGVGSGRGDLMQASPRLATRHDISCARMANTNQDRSGPRDEADTARSPPRNVVGASLKTGEDDGPPSSTSPASSNPNSPSLSLAHQSSRFLLEERIRANIALRDRAAVASRASGSLEERLLSRARHEGHLMLPPRHEDELSRMASNHPTEPLSQEFFVGNDAQGAATANAAHQTASGKAKAKDTSSAPSASLKESDPSGSPPHSPAAILPGKGLVLALPTDKGFVSSYQSLIRECLEFSQAQKEDVMWHTQGRKHKVSLGQVGVRCRFCARRAANLRGRGSVYFPGKLAGVYAAAQNMTTTHLLESCEDIPADMREALGEERRNQRIHDRRGGGRKYWVESCKKMGLKEREEQSGIWM